MILAAASAHGDTDNDGVADASDNCPAIANPQQFDQDNDGIGDACDPDRDNDGILNSNDSCPTYPNTNQADSSADGFGDVCPADIQKVFAGENTANNLFGSAIDADGDYLIVGLQSGKEAVYLYKQVAPGNWQQIVKLQANDTATGDFFGRAVAIDGNTIVVGAFGDDDSGSLSGSAYVFVNDGFDNWTQQDKLVAADGTASDRFGGAVAIHGDTVIVGADNDGDFANAAGSAYVFTRNGDIWSQQAKLVSNDLATFDRLGGAVAVHGDSAFISARFDDDNGGSSGSVYLFERDNTGAWLQSQKLIAAPGASSFNAYGSKLSFDGSRLLVGSRNTNPNGADGIAYVYTKNSGSWTLEASLFPSDRLFQSGFPHNFSISGLAIDGDQIVVGASGDLNAGFQSGAAYIFDRDPLTSTWSESGKLLASDAAESDLFGFAATVDNQTAFIGAISANNEVTGVARSGAVYVFDVDGINNPVDTDSDGVIDSNDNCPNDANADQLNTDGDAQGNVCDADDDNDGVDDTDDAFPLDASESSDNDNDGMGNNADNDDDNDGTLDIDDAFPFDASESVDTDSDGIGNNADTDDDNDGVLDTNDAFPLDASESLDTDNDGIGNNADTDDDNDGTPDINDAFPLDASETLDTDNDGIGNNADTDDDNDGAPDVNDAFPLDATESLDTDSDGIGNNADTDDDNDNTPDTLDAFPFDPTESVDTDTDGIGNNTDTDDDNDGVLDTEDAFPLDANETIDSDNDGTGNNADTDDDNDGVSDLFDSAPLDSFFDGTVLSLLPGDRVVHSSSSVQNLNEFELELVFNLTELNSSLVQLRSGNGNLSLGVRDGNLQLLSQTVDANNEVISVVGDNAQTAQNTGLVLSTNTWTTIRLSKNSSGEITLSLSTLEDVENTVTLVPQTLSATASVSLGLAANSVSLSPQANVSGYINRLKITDTATNAVSLLWSMQGPTAAQINNAEACESILINQINNNAQGSDVIGAVLVSAQ